MPYHGIIMMFSLANALKNVVGSDGTTHIIHISY